MQFRILGSVEVETGGRILSLPSRRERCLLGVLLLEANRVVPVDRLAELLWEDTPPKRIRGALQGNVSRLRAILGRAGDGNGVDLVFAGDGYRLVVDPETVDAHRFRALLERAARLSDLAERAERLRAALDLWRGPALADAVSGAARARLCSGLEEQRLSAFEDLASVSLALRREREILPELVRFAGDHPGRESLTGLHMRALYQAGRRVDALDVYARARAYLADELGIDPGPELREVHQALLRDEVIAKPAPATSREEPASAGNLVPAPRELPADVADFTGRAELLTVLDGSLPQATSASPAISAIVGTAGVGKTALAVHWAHRVADRFPDGQLYINLFGYDATAPLRPIDALASFLRSWGIPPAQIPTDQSQAAAMYRSQLAGRRVLVVLDNAGSVDQVRPLLPGAPGCTVLVTSRDRLTGLVARDGARRVIVDVLSPTEAVTLLARMLGAGRVEAEQAGAAKLARACVFLPLAIRIAAANLANHPRMSIADYAAELSRGDRLHELQADGDQQSAVRAALDLSYQSISTAAQRLFRLSGLVPGPEVDPIAAAALADIDASTAGQLLDRLAGAHLLQEGSPGRYTAHDLLRLFAGQLGVAIDSRAERDGAQDRLLAWYLRGTDTAAHLIYPQMLRLPADSAAVPEPPAAFADPVQALAWLDAERTNLVAAIDYANASGRLSVAWRLADNLRGYFVRRRHMVDWLAAATNALTAAERGDDRQAQAAANISLAVLHQYLGSHPEAIACFHAAADLARESGWADGEAGALGNLGTVYRDQGDLVAAAEHYALALAICQRSGRLGGQATNRSRLAAIERELGRSRQAAEHGASALELFQQLGSREGEAATLQNLGLAYLDMGRLDLARAHVERSLALQRDIGDRAMRGVALDALAAIDLEAGNLIAARQHGEAALALVAGLKDLHHEAVVHNTLGDVHLRLGELTVAIDYYQKAVDLTRRTGIHLPELQAMIGQAAARCRLGQYEVASRLAEDALHRATTSSYRMLQGHALNVLAHVRLRQGDLDAAAAYARRALESHRETGHRIGEARALLVLGYIEKISIGPDAAKRRWRAAHRLFAEAGVPPSADLPETASS